MSGAVCRPPVDPAWLNATAGEVGAVWSYCSAISLKQDSCWKAGRPRKPLSGFDLCDRTGGDTGFCDSIGADTIQRHCHQPDEGRGITGQLSPGNSPALSWDRP